MEYLKCLGMGIVFSALQVALWCLVYVVSAVLYAILEAFLLLFGAEVRLPPGTSHGDILLPVTWVVFGFIVLLPILGYVLREHDRRGEEIGELLRENESLKQRCLAAGAQVKT